MDDQFWLCTVIYDQIQTYVSKYQDPRQADTIMRVQQELDETKIVLVCMILFVWPIHWWQHIRSTRQSSQSLSVEKSLTISSNVPMLWALRARCSIRQRRRYVDLCASCTFSPISFPHSRTHVVLLHSSLWFSRSTMPVMRLDDWSDVHGL
jgi:hypothetical protein